MSASGVYLADLDAACGATPSRFCEVLHDLTGNDDATKTIDWLATGPIKILLIILVAFIIRRLVNRSINRFVESQLVAINADAQAEAEDIPEDDVFDTIEAKARERLARIYDRSSRAEQRLVTLGSVLKSIAGLVIVIITLLLVLSEANINLGPLIAGAGIAGIAIGFGAQSLVRDFLSGMFIVIEDQYGVGDVVDLGDAAGTVEQVSLRTTRLRDLDGTVWYVPNGEIHRVANKSKLWARSVVDITVAYGADIDQAIAVIKTAADALWREQPVDATIIEEPEVLGVQDLAADAVVIRIAVKTEPAEQFATARQLRQRIKASLDAAGIDIPFPQRTVWIKDDRP